MDLQDEAQDDWVPLCCLQQFAASLHAGAARLMADVLGGSDAATLAPEPAAAAAGGL